MNKNKTNKMNDKDEPEFAVAESKAKVFVVMLCLRLLQGLTLGKESWRSAERDVAVDALKELLRDVRRDVTDQELLLASRDCWGFFHRMVLPDWLRKGWMNTLQYLPKFRRVPGYKRMALFDATLNKWEEARRG